MNPRLRIWLHNLLPSIFADPVPDLIERLKDREDAGRPEAVKMLGDIYPPMIPALASQLASSKAELRLQAAADLALIGPRAAEAVPALIEALRRAEGEDRNELAETLPIINPPGDLALPALMGVIRESTDELSRLGAVAGVRQYGPVGEEAAPALLEALEDSSEEVRDAAAVALGRIDGSGETSVPKLLEMLAGHARVEVRASAADALSCILPLATDGALPGLARALKDESLDVRTAAAAALAEIGPEPQGLYPVLNEVLKEEREALRKNPPPFSEDNIDLELLGCSKAMEKGSIEERMTVTTILRVVGVLDRVATGRVYRQSTALIVAPLIIALDHHDPRLRAAAALALGEIAPEENPHYLSLFERLKKEEDPRARDAAIWALGELDAYEEEIRSLLDHLKASPVTREREAGEAALAYLDGTQDLEEG